MKVKPLFVRAEWDDEARVWVASSDDVPGLATEGDTLEGLVDKLKVMIPELLEANGSDEGKEVPFEILTRRSPYGQRGPQTSRITKKVLDRSSLSKCNSFPAGRGVS